MARTKHISPFAGAHASLSQLLSHKIGSLTNTVTGLRQSMTALKSTTTLVMMMFGLAQIVATTASR
jgi:hypothetical protein